MTSITPRESIFIARMIDEAGHLADTAKAQGNMLLAGTLEVTIDALALGWAQDIVPDTIQTAQVLRDVICTYALNPDEIPAL